MKTEPRRTDRKIKTPREMELLLERMPVGRLAVVTEDGPYVVAVNYVFFENCIYFHSGLSGRKMEALQADPRVCFLVDEVGPLVLLERSCGISQVYKSVVCFGKAGVVEGSLEKRAILERMVQKYVPSTYPVPPIGDENIENTAIVRIAIESMSGKENPLSPVHTVIR
ncbi:pyridoxamine 5'-phosphate oxidase family protein [Geobacter grbiciae]|uniref:pyridoxamine 5'-phosphate oxidase family protein n=1 Tax=Geobacter grbiciae TaxID=155042 RepID=UPI001C00A751|nr:pyridoxamine 5'-phosphate oxidase family protein [Geobacter grbiciae]MBT1074965.1 pyridoxamine 5'-phosphate oxidase family protein [Geobacter grbiciae]